jgi:hypothetical protein
MVHPKIMRTLSSYILQSNGTDDYLKYSAKNLNTWRDTSFRIHRFPIRFKTFHQATKIVTNSTTFHKSYSFLQSSMFFKCCERIFFTSQKIATYLVWKTTEERGSGSIKNRSGSGRPKMYGN